MWTIFLQVPWKTCRYWNVSQELNTIYSQRATMACPKTPIPLVTPDAISTHRGQRALAPFSLIVSPTSACSPSPTAYSLEETSGLVRAWNVIS